MDAGPSPNDSEPLATRKRRTICTHAFTAFGLSGEFRFHPPPRRQGKALARKLEKELLRLEAKFSLDGEASELARINASAGDAAGTEVDEECAGLLDYAALCHERSEGLFDISMTPLARLWNFNQPNSGTLRVTPPAEDCLQQALALTGWSKLQWQERRLVLPAGMVLDLGVLLPDYASDRCARLAKELGIEHGLMELDGNVRVFGPRPDSSPWPVGLRNAQDPGKPLGRVLLDEGALVSRGDCQRLIEIDGKRYVPWLDPRSGWPVSGLSQVSVAAEESLTAGTLALIALLKGERGADWLDAQGLPNVRVSLDGEVEGALF